MNRLDLQNKTDEEVKSLADSGNFIGIFEYGMRLYNKENYKEAFKYLYSVKDHDNFFIWEKIIDIAYYYEKGIISDKELFDMVMKRHLHGSSHYTYILAYLYRDGRGTRRSLKKYIECLKICSNDGSAFATYELADCYEKGIGVKKSPHKAFNVYYNWLDDHGRMDYLCAYKTALYMLNEWGGAKKDMSNIEFHLRYAARGEREAEKLYIELFRADPFMKPIEIKGNNYLGKFNKIRVACRAVIVKDDKILTSYASKKDIYMLPGGGLEEGESNIDCVTREVEEETGLIVKPTFLTLQIDEYYGDEKYISQYYLCDIIGQGERKLTEQEIESGMEPRWMSIKELIDIFSTHETYRDKEEEVRGIYLREYTGLTNILNKKKEA